jgi:hypothetical protein
MLRLMTGAAQLKDGLARIREHTSPGGERLHSL